MIKYWLKQASIKKKSGNHLWSFYYKLGKLIVNLFYPLSQFFNHHMGIDPNGEVIVSLTSFPQRIRIVWVTIASLMNQTTKPKEIILWLAKEQFPDQKVPYSLRQLEKRGLRIQYCEDLKPHKKYFYSMKLYPNNTIITADDDIFYPEDHIETLINCAKQHPKCIVCHWSHEILFNENNEFLPYNDWPNESKQRPSFSLLPVGCNGVLYPPKALSTEAFNVKKLTALSLSTDDLWLKCMALLNDTKAINCDEEPIIYFNNVLSQFTGLWKSNAGSGINRNDLVWNSLIREYPLAKDKLISWKEEKL